MEPQLRTATLSEAAEARNLRRLKIAVRNERNNCEVATRRLAKVGLIGRGPEGVVAGHAAWLRARPNGSSST